MHQRDIVPSKSSNFHSAMNADIQDMEERIMMEQRLLKEVTEEMISPPIKKLIDNAFS